VQISPDELALITSALRVTNTIYKDKAKLAKGQGRHAEYAQWDNYANACADLAARLDGRGPRRSPLLIIPGR